jgi:hypothetical protein
VDYHDHISQAKGSYLNRLPETVLTTNIYVVGCFECKHIGQSADLK